MKEENFNQAAKIAAALRALPRWRLALASLSTVLGYGALVAHDAIALQHLRRRVALPRIALAGFITYAFSNSSPVSLVVAGGIRHRLYRRWGVDAGDTGRMTGLTTMSSPPPRRRFPAPALVLQCGSTPSAGSRPAPGWRPWPRPSFPSRRSPPCPSGRE